MGITITTAPEITELEDLHGSYEQQYSRESSASSCISV